MGKFDAGRFGSAMAKNLGGFGMQYFQNQMVQNQQREKEKRAYTRDVDKTINELVASGLIAPEDTPADYQARNAGFLATIRGVEGGIYGKQREREKKALEEKYQIAQKYQKPSAFSEQMTAFQQNPEQFKAFQQAKSPQDETKIAIELLKMRGLLTDAQVKALDLKLKTLSLKEKETKIKEGELTPQKIESGIMATYDAWKKVPNKYKGFIEGPMTEAGLKGYDSPAVARYKALKGLWGQNIARIFEKGRMSDQDRTFYMKLWFNPKTEDPKAARAGMEAVKWAVKTIMTKGQLLPGARPPWLKAGAGLEPAAPKPPTPTPPTPQQPAEPGTLEYAFPDKINKINTARKLGYTDEEIYDYLYSGKAIP